MKKIRDGKELQFHIAADTFIRLYGMLGQAMVEDMLTGDSSKLDVIDKLLLEKRCEMVDLIDTVDQPGEK